jgi:hypothetical protein
MIRGKKNACAMLMQPDHVEYTMQNNLKQKISIHH